ncbi:MAG: recombinase family protein, partial [candidate division Zixibacteria bacterium]|nr:recombinase family protein [candidate division Zixibacteria bacterium]
MKPGSEQSREQRVRLPAPTETIRCAIYTRKSTTEGLDSDFSTLDAQREACQAYILSQKTEGWIASETLYDDGGFTGGNTGRPALQALLLDIQSGQIDCVVVYKVDRLSRSLLDFVKLMEVFEQHEVSFVSVTQQFNTATSMGRLVLNVLLSFAQFEREIISERTSDKMCAARRKGKWVGGPPVLGYDLDRELKRLILDPNEAKIVRELFDLYLKKESMLKVAREANRRGWKTKSWVTRNGKIRNGRSFDKADLQRIFTNVTYTGHVRHRDEVFPGEHVGIIDPSVFQQVQTLIEKNRNAGGKAYRNPHAGLLKRLLRCGNCGAAMGHTYTQKKNKLYRYYLCTTKQKQGWQSCDTPFLPAQDIEDFVVEMIKRIGSDPELMEQAFAETIALRESQRAGLEHERREQCAEQQQAKTRIERLVAMIDSSDTSLSTVREHLNKAEQIFGQTEQGLAEIDEKLKQFESETVDRDRLFDALTRFG